MGQTEIRSCGCVSDVKALGRDSLPSFSAPVRTLDRIRGGFLDRSRLTREWQYGSASASG